MEDKGVLLGVDFGAYNSQPLLIQEDGNWPHLHSTTNSRKDILPHVTAVDHAFIFIVSQHIRMWVFVRLNELAPI